MLNRIIQLLFAVTSARVKELNDDNFAAELEKQEFMMVLAFDPMHKSL